MQFPHSYRDHTVSATVSLIVLHMLALLLTISNCQRYCTVSGTYRDLHYIDTVNNTAFALA